MTTVSHLGPTECKRIGLPDVSGCESWVDPNVGCVCGRRCRRCWGDSNPLLWCYLEGNHEEVCVPVASSIPPSHFAPGLCQSLSQSANTEDLLCECWGHCHSLMHLTVVEAGTPLGPGVGRDSTPPGRFSGGCLIKLHRWLWSRAEVLALPNSRPSLSGSPPA